MFANIQSRAVAAAGTILIAAGLASPVVVGAGDSASSPGILNLGAGVRAARPSLSNLLGSGAHRRQRSLESLREHMAAAAAVETRRGSFGADVGRARLAAFAQAQGVASASEDAFDNSWKELGPLPYHADGEEVVDLGWDVVAGRITALAVDPSDAAGNTLWAGAAGGGVWYSSDAGEHWVPKFDDQPALAVGAVAVDAANPDIVYVGTGEANTAIENYYGAGVFRTKNRGLTWERVAKNIPEASAVSRIEIAAGRIFVSTNRGLFRSTDGGDSYRDVRLPTNAEGTAPYDGIFANFVSDVRIKPDDPNVITAAVGWRKGKKGCTDPPKPDCAPGNGLYRSTNGGDSFTRMSPIGFGDPGRSGDPIGRTSLGYSKQQPNVLWAIIQDAGLFNNETFLGAPLPAKSNILNGVYRSGDNGQSWLLKATSESFTAAPGSGRLGTAIALGAPGVQSWYNQWVEVDPNDPENVLVGLEEIYLTAANANGPGNAVWTTVGRYWNACLGIYPTCDEVGVLYEGKTTHPDQHAAAFATTPEGSRFYAGNDGGVYRQDVGPDGLYDNTAWTSLNDTLGTTQPYYAVIGGDGTVYAGFQDNGTSKITPAGLGRMVAGGDGFDVAVDPGNSDIAYEEYTFGSIAKTTNGGESWESFGPALNSALFITPFEMDRLNPKHLVLVANNIVETEKGEATVCDEESVGGIVIAGSCDWSTVFEIGTRTDAKKRTFTYQSGAVDVRGANVYVGFCGACDPINQGSGDPTVFANGIATNVEDGCVAATGSGDCWHKIERPKGLPNRFITDIAVDPKDPKTIYVTLGGYGRRWLHPKVAKATDAGRGNVFVSQDAGRSFTDVSGNIPESPANAVTVLGDELFVGNDLGVYVAPKAGRAWSRLGAGLPNASVLDLNANPQGSKLVAATHGRGIWLYDFGGSRTAKAGPPGGGGGTKVLPSRETRRTLPSTGARSLAGIGLMLLVSAGLLGRRVRGG